MIGTHGICSHTSFDTLETVTRCARSDAETVCEIAVCRFPWNLVISFSDCEVKQCGLAVGQQRRRIVSRLYLSDPHKRAVGYIGDVDDYLLNAPVCSDDREPGLRPVSCQPMFDRPIEDDVVVIENRKEIIDGTTSRNL